MGSLYEAMKQSHEDGIKASESSSKLGITNGLKVLVTGEVYWSPRCWLVKNAPATVVDHGYPSTALVQFDSGERGYVLKEDLRHTSAK